MDLDQLKIEIYKLLSSYNIYANYLPSKDEEDKELDYFNNVYVVYSLKDIEDMGYKNNISLEIQIVSSLDNKDKTENIALEIDKIFNGLYMENVDSKFIHPNIFYIPLDDLEDKKAIITLQYKIFIY